MIAFDMGATPEEIVQRYSSVDITSVYEVIAYVLRHRPAVDEYLIARQKKVGELRAEIEKRFPSDGLRARLLARRDSNARSDS